MTAPVMGAGDFEASLGCLFASELDELAAQLFSIPGLQASERAVIAQETRASVVATLHGKLSRLLLLELNAARLRGQLAGETPERRWAEFLALSSRPEFWDAIAPEYPGMRGRVARIVANRCANSLRFAQRFAADRRALDAFAGAPLGPLAAVRFGAGDTHQQGQAVAVVECAGGRVVYKPRSLAVDAALGAFIDELFAHDASPHRIRVPRVLQREDHGWTEFVEHRHAADDDELRSFYLGIGHWLALMRLVGGSDLHSENLIAHGGTPVVVDCETLFTPRLPQIPAGLGNAVDRAMEVTNSTVLASGLLPGRSGALGWRGVDSSALGGLPGQQPRVRRIEIVGAGTDEARIGADEQEIEQSQNLPGTSPALATYWPDVVRGFDALTARLQALDAAGLLAPRLERFKPCRIRVVPRATEVYAEIGRMLWHPASLHDEAAAVARGVDLLRRMAARVRIAPHIQEIVEAEVADLQDGDIPFYTTRAGHGALDGPRGTRWLKPSDLVEEALQAWRVADFALERRVIRAALVSAYINEGWIPPEGRMAPARVDTARLDARRRAQAAAIMRELVASRIDGDDGTVSWIAPVLNPDGWSVQPLEQDLYNGASGLLLLVAGYEREVAAGRADAVDGVAALLPRLHKTLRCAELQREKQTREVKHPRPGSPGAYIGLGSQIWTLLTLRRLGHDPGECLERACGLASFLPASVAADEAHELLVGKAGAIVPLLMLARATGQHAYRDMAIDIGDRLLAAARVRESDGAMCWKQRKWPEGVGGFAHGATGISWALAKLARASGEPRFAAASDAAARFEESLWNEAEGNWTDLRFVDGVGTAAAWCHGSVGIGLAQLDLDPALAAPGARERVRRAADATWRMGMGWNHSLCHGDLGAAELLVRAVDAGLAPEGMTREGLLAWILGSMERHGAVCGIVRDTFSPGLMPGLGGVAYQLLRMHPDCDLPSVLVLGEGTP
jgi:type 2 lantibiotic biosynthesis protein LanM